MSLFEAMWEVGRLLLCDHYSALSPTVPLGPHEETVPFPPCVPSPFCLHISTTERMLHRSHFHSLHPRVPPQYPAPAGPFLNPPSWHCLPPCFPCTVCYLGSTGTFIHLGFEFWLLKNMSLSPPGSMLGGSGCRQPVSVPLDLGSCTVESEVPGSRPNSVIVIRDLDHTT